MLEIPSLPPQLGVWTAEQLTHRAESFLITQLVTLDGELDDAVLADAVRTALSEADVLHLEPEQHGDDVLPSAVPGNNTPSIAAFFDESAQQEFGGKDGQRQRQLRRPIRS